MQEEIQQLKKCELRADKVKRNDFLALPRHPIHLILDGVESAHNVGCILRMADAVLVSQVFLCGTSCLPGSKKVRKGSRGTERWVPWEYVASTRSAVLQLKSQGICIVAIELCNDGQLYSQAEYKGAVCFVLGNERFGVSKDVLDLVDRSVYLPMLGMSNSLNVATAASVILYDALQKIQSNNLLIGGDMQNI